MEKGDLNEGVFGWEIEMWKLKICFFSSPSRPDSCKQWRDGEVEIPYPIFCTCIPNARPISG